MAKSPDPAGQWRQISVIIRADIFDKAKECAVDISDTCNRALADRLGIDYEQQHLMDIPLPKPIMIAQNTVPDPANGVHVPRESGSLIPVINADDFSSVKKVIMLKHHTATKPGVPAAASSLPLPASEPPLPVKDPVRKSAAGPAAKKMGKSEVFRKFIDARLSRTDDPEACMSRDDMYHAFSRWCRDHRRIPVPDRKELAVALKNKYAFAETVIDGKMVWTNVRLK